jgi:hypothetical protein
MKILTWQETKKIIEKIAADAEFDGSKKEFFIQKNGEKIFRLKLPLLLSKNFNAENIKTFESLDENFLIILIRAGNAALAGFSDGKMLFHKVIRKYMVRKKQGKAQIKHLKTRGKSRYGSRLRLQKSLEFFREINLLANHACQSFDFERIFIFIPVNYRKLMTESTVKPVFLQNKKAEKIPFPVRTPNFREVKKTQSLMRKGFVLCDKENILDNFRQEDERDADLW